MIRTAYSFALGFTLFGLPSVEAQESAISPDRVIDFIAEGTHENSTVHLNDQSSLTMDRDEIWSTGEDGELFVSGKGMGYIRSNQAYRDYHLVLEYKWGERALAGRADRARDCGLLIHAFGPDGAYGNTWMSCIEAQLIEGGSGDFLVLATKDEDGNIDPTSITAEVKRDRDGEPVWTPGAEKETFPAEGKTMARVNWRDRDPDWADVKGYRGEKEIENPVGEWNRIEVICKDDTIQIFLNGELVNEVTDCNPSEGYIGLQSEYAECHIRRFELHPLGTFDEKWAAKATSTDMGYSITGESILPRNLPLSPEESAAMWEIDGDYEIQLVASEPLTCDPVDVTWDAQGRMFVAEMGDYPLPVDEEGPFLSRIRLLSDTDGDGVMDKAVTWADNLDHVQGIMPMNGGLLATTRTAILFLQDTDGDDVADVRKPLFHSNEPRHNQLQVSSPRYGLDNHIYLSNGLDGKEIYPDDQPDAKVAFTKLNLRYNPRTGALETSAGAGQFGGTLDDFNRHFFCSNRNPAMFAAMPLAAVTRNPLAGITVGHEDIQPPGAPVFPIALSHTTSAAHAGTHTAACGLGLYRGDLIPEMTGDLFVCDPTAQLVTRNKLVPDGASFDAERVGEKKEFLASGDEWARPVQVRNGPDGALYVCDMYRRFIDHARFFPEDFSKSHYMRAGVDQGRIWRIVPKGGSADKVEALPESSAELVEILKDKNGWKRTEAQRLIVEKQDNSVVGALEALLNSPPSPETQAHALWTLDGLGALKPEHVATALNSKSGGVVDNALFAATTIDRPESMEKTITGLIDHDSARVRFLTLALFPELEQSSDHLAELVTTSPNGYWFRKAIMSAKGDQSTDILVVLLAEDGLRAGDPAKASEALTDFARIVAAQATLPDLKKVINQLGGESDWWQFAVIAGLSDGIRRSQLKQKSLAALIAAAPEELGDSTARLSSLLESATVIALDRSKPTSARKAALPLVAQLPWDEKIAVVEKLIELTEDPAIQAAAIQSIARDDRTKVADFFFERWDTLAPTPLREAVAVLSSNTVSGLLLMKKMKAGEISPFLMPAMTRWSYGRSSNEEIKSLAIELFGTTDTDRAAVIADYRKSLADHKGDAAKGELVFQKAACMTCHKVGEVGIEVGPTLDDVKIKPAEALLTDILDPNRAVEERWVSVVVETKDGRNLSGLVHGDDASAITLRLPGGLTETIPRTEVVSVSPTGMSLMPIGLEAAITKEDMADLLAFLKKR